MDINFELYKIFYHAAKHESFTHAAEELYISQSAVSQAIKSLESKTGCSLFYRKSRSIRLTSEGQLLFKHVEQAYNFIKTAENKLAEMQNLNSGEIRIGVSDTVCRYFLTPHLQMFNTMHPGIKIQVINRTSSRILDSLKNGAVDFGIVTLPIEDKSFQVTPFISVQDIFVACDKFSLLKDNTWSLRDLSSYPLLMLEKNSTTRRNFDSYIDTLGLDIIPEIELESVDLLVEFAKIGLGIANVLRESAADSIRKGELFEVKTFETPPERVLGIATMRDVPLSFASAEFIGSLMESRSKNKGGSATFVCASVFPKY